MAALEDDARALLGGRSFGNLATLLPDGSPHVIPVWVGAEGEHVVFFTQPSSRKARNIAADPRVAISLIDEDNPYRSLAIRGAVTGTLEGDEALAVIDRISQRYTGQDFPMRSGVVYLVTPDRVRVTELPFTH
ncbi:MAG: PPOX class F420-dependent oxidoreductase [Solirubrobacteraceae bacterium]|nr:PPOX class F420-dependent oxidoreductase [Solirubrobacteraceae bacterium]